MCFQLLPVLIQQKSFSKTSFTFPETTSIIIIHSISIIHLYNLLLNSKKCEEKIPCLFIPFESEAKVLLFFHGNAEDIGIAFEILMEIRNCLKVNVLAMEYPGYGLYSS